MKEMIFATGNAGKVREIQEILAGLGITIKSMKEAGIKADIVEDGTTYEENSLIKARELVRLTGLPAIADDSGIEIKAMDWGPGIYSARYLGEDTSYDIKNPIILEKLKGKTGDERAARYVCAAALCLPDGREFTTRAVFDGEIAYEAKGSNGFGYDPIFYIPSFGKTTAEMSPEEKNEISHRGKAFRQLREIIEKEVY
ncbi:MAG: RdgB/HAM1 family non-canonical purine NTP pyrophosphatase [Lachnospiraceae bacterium]|nr:RdgB/HAM1 family non-canonical purine NTP pyrophosphatase [Lachnospiraceae bacterium]